MSTILPKHGTFHGILALITLVLVTSLCSIPIFIAGLLKLIPYKPWRIICAKFIDRIAVIWTGLLGIYLKRSCPMKWHITGVQEFNPQEWYLVLANHQSWLDIVILQQFFHRKIPVLKFFIKEQLKWVPLFNFAWWSMGCPFMKRYSKEYLEKNPHKKGQDLKATQKALKHFKSYPSSIISFVEGTRYTPQKKLQQKSPYHHLLKPKAGGISQVIGIMGNQLQPVIDVTIVYGNPNASLWDYLCHRLDEIHVDVRLIAVPEKFSNGETALNNNDIQAAFRTWLNEQWTLKDDLINDIKSTQAAAKV